MELTGPKLEKFKNNYLVRKTFLPLAFNTSSHIIYKMNSESLLTLNSRSFSGKNFKLKKDLVMLIEHPLF